MKNLLLAGMVLVCLGSPAAAADPTGEWLVEDGSARIRVEPCKGALWGIISWTKNPPGKDENNPDPEKRNRSVIGMPILLNMERSEPNRWDGEVYNAKNGRTYTAYISLVRKNVLRIDGCVLGGLLCGGQHWTRVPAQERSKLGAKQMNVCSSAAG